MARFPHHQCQPTTFLQKLVAVHFANVTVAVESGPTGESPVIFAVNLFVQGNVPSSMKLAHNVHYVIGASIIRQVSCRLPGRRRASLTYQHCPGSIFASKSRMATWKTFLECWTLATKMRKAELKERKRSEAQAESSEGASSSKMPKSPIKDDVSEALIKDDVLEDLNKEEVSEATSTMASFLSKVV